MSRLSLSAAPAKEPVTLTDMKDHLRIDTDIDLEAEEIKYMISAARRWCENFQHRAYITQTWQWALDAWPASPFDVPLPPLQSATIAYYDTDETAATFSSSYYQTDIISEPGRISLVYGQSYPTTTLRPINGIIVTFIAGYGTSESDVPENIRQAIKLLVGHMYENRENTWIKPLEEIPMGVESLLWQDRVMVLG